MYRQEVNTHTFKKLAFDEDILENGYLQANNNDERIRMFHCIWVEERMGGGNLSSSSQEVPIHTCKQWEEGGSHGTFSRGSF